MEEISETIQEEWRHAAQEVKHRNRERVKRGQRHLSEEQWRARDVAQVKRAEAARRKTATSKRGLETYFIQGEVLGLIKIGIAKHLEERIKILQIGSPDKLRVLKTVLGNVEKVYHKRFAHLRQHGEWFTPAPELLDFINKL